MHEHEQQNEHEPIDAVQAAGWFGKLPALGDFAARRLPEVFIHEWDDWLQHGLAAAYESLVQIELPTRDVPPIRRFWLGRGVLGPTCWTGLLMPSVDRVGRRFPLTVAVPALPDESQPMSLASALQSRDWFAAVDALMREALDVALGVDEFETRLAQLAVGLEVPDAESPWLLPACVMLQAFAPAGRGGEGRRGALRAVEAAESEVIIDIARAAEALPCSVWWCDGALDPDDFLRYGALPPASEVGPLLVAT